MPTVLIVDDSSSTRTIVGKALREIGFEVEQAEDGEQCLAFLEMTKVDLILLEVTMPKMDGPTMLKHLRERGDRTPVIILTRESKRSIVAGVMKLGIEDYMLKPFKPDDLKAKVFKALRVSEAATGAAAASVSASAAPTAPAAGGAGNRPSVDIMVVDDMDNVHKKFRQAIAAHVTVLGSVRADEAVTQCKEAVFRIVLIDMVIPGINSAALMNQLRALQPHATFVALVLRSTCDPRAEVTAAGFADFLYKPFDPAATAELLGRHLEIRDVLEVDGDLLTATAFDGKEDKLDRYYDKLKGLVKKAVEQLASACYDDVILDLRRLPVRAQKTIRFVIDAVKEAKLLGLSLRLVGGAELAGLLKRVTETAELPLHTSPDQARSLAA